MSELVTKFGLSDVAGLSLSQVSAILESSKKDEFYNFLKKRFTVAKFDSKYSALESINIKAIFSTNIDDLLFKIYAKSVAHYINDLMLRGPSFSDRTAIDLIPLHGSIIHEDESLTFSTLDIASSFSSDPDKWHVLTERLQANPMLFWGYSITDAGVLQALSPLTSKGRTQKHKWILLRERDKAAIQYFQALGFYIIISDTLEMLDYLLAFKPTSVRAKPSSRATRHLFPDLAIPSVGEVPVRPLLEFYLGAPPSWADIFSGRLHTSSHYPKIVDSIKSAKDTIVLGLAACGKSTLLMQVAKDMSYDGHKLVCSQLSKEKAHLILNNLGSDKAIVFVDDFASDIEGFNVMLKASNVLTVGFDRDYQFQIISHKIDREKCNILEVTELDDRDIQQIFSKIPNEIRVNSLNRPAMEHGNLPSLYEVIQKNITRPTLQTRFQSVLAQLQRQDQLLHDLLVMSCYVHSCRVPVSYDTVSAFLRGYISTYTDVYRMIERLGSIISEYFGNLVENEQDYYTPRSVVVSEAIMKQVQPEAFKRVLLRFHDQVSPLRICRFDIFKRSAFDRRFAEKAFSNWQDGKDFYEKVYQRDGSPYLLQQGALYLLTQHRFTEAFNWIDEALLQSGNKVASIRNSHAVILFDANFEKQETDGTVRRTLDQSMQILAECYNYDKRKTYHVIQYADQALKYDRLYRDDKSREYLQTADKWLIEEERNSPWNREVKRYRRLVQGS